MEQLVVLRGHAQYFVQVVAVGVGDECLSEGISAHQCHDAFHSLRVQSVEDVIQQQYWPGSAARMVQKLVLCQFQCHQHGLVLSLASFSAYWISVYHHLQVIAVYAMQRVSYGQVLVAVTLDDFQ